MKDEFVIYIPLLDVLVTAKPLITIQLLVEILKPETAPLTIVPGDPRNVIGAPLCPELLGLTCSVYVPGNTWTVSPATARAAAGAMRQKG